MTSNDPIALPPPRRSGPCGLESLLWRRRSVRDYGPGPITLPELGQLLWAAGGIAEAEGKRTVPSAGAQYPLSVHVAARNVTGLGSGLYRYDPDGHRLMPGSACDVSAALADAAIGAQPWLAGAALVLILSGAQDRMVEHFRDQPPDGRRGITYLAMEAGAAGQNVYLQATALGLGMVFVGGFCDNEIREILKSNSEERALALLAVGRLPS